MRSELLAPFERLLDDSVSSSVVREIEAGGTSDALWGLIQRSGYLDALVPVREGGAGLSGADAGLLAFSIGQRVVPIPFSQTLAARALLGRDRVEVPEGRLLLVTPVLHEGTLTARAVPLGMTGDFALIDLGDHLVLSGILDAERQPAGLKNGLGADLFWTVGPAGTILSRPHGGLRPIAAMLRAAEIAGACDRLLGMTLGYAATRHQFGKPIGEQQAIQQQLAIMAEQTVMARMAAEIGCASGFPPTLIAAAVAKQGASEAAAKVAAIAHLVHGAIGVSEEFDLQLYTRRLYEWRFADGSVSYWEDVIGRERLSKSAATTLDFVRAIA